MTHAHLVVVIMAHATVPRIVLVWVDLRPGLVHRDSAFVVCVSLDYI